jgi:hypothetical protein
MRTLWLPVTDKGEFRSPFFTSLKPLYTLLFDSKYTMVGLLLLGILRTIFVMLAYAPAGGADAMDYYAYAAYMNGADLPSSVASVSPLYPMFIYFNYYILGNFSLIVIWQVVMSSLLGLIYYIGLRRYNAFLAVLIALMVIGDMESAPMFSLLATEPLYIFLLACLYNLVLLQNERIATHSTRVLDVVVGLVLVLLQETRTVARYLFLPILIASAVSTRSWKRILITCVSFIVTALVFNLAIEVASVEQVTSYNDSMLLRPLLAGQLLDEDAGTASAALSEWVDLCREKGYFRIFDCLEIELNSAEAAQNLINEAYIEVIARDPLIVYKSMFEQFTDFLQLPGKQLNDIETPAVAQCADVPARINRQVEYTTTIEWAHLSITPQQYRAYASVVTEYFYQLCPPTYTHPTIRTLVDRVAQRYRSLSRPNPYLWYILLIMAVLGIRWARRLWLPVFLAGGLLAYHAAISAAVYNIQARYVVVTNPFKGILVITLLFIIGYFILKIADYWLDKPVSVSK